MIKIENISVKEKYSISLYFNRSYTKENIILGVESSERGFFSNENGEIYENINFKRNFGELIEDGLMFAKSADLQAVRKCADGLTAVMQQGKGNTDIEPYKAELFRLYNSSDNIVEQYVILKLWHELMVTHMEIFKLKNAMRRKEWERLGGEYGKFADRMLMPFEKRFTCAEDVAEFSGEVRIGALAVGKGFECVYTFEGDILPLYVLYLTELARHGKLVLTCEICGRDFVAARKDTKVCGAECKAKRQSGFFKAHKEKVKDDEVDRLYQRNRNGYDNFRKKLEKLGAADEVKLRYLDKKAEFLEQGRELRKMCRDGKISEKELVEFVRSDMDKRVRLEREIFFTMSS